MITAVHTLIFSDDPAATRAFLRDVLGWPFVGSTPESDGDPNDWLIFGTGRSELGVHPTSGEHEGEIYTAPRRHQITLMCDDLTATMAELSERGATFTREPRDEGWGISVSLAVPGADDIDLYQPRHGTAYQL